MTAPFGRDNQILAHYRRMESRFIPRRQAMNLIHEVREGRIKHLFPKELDFSVTFHGSPISNFVDIVAHDMAEGIAPLPSLACVSGKMQSDADQRRAEVKNRIGDNYWRQCRLEYRMETGADQYVTYGFLPFYIEPCLDYKLPYIHIEDPRDAMYEKDRFGEVRFYAYRIRKTIDELCAEFPELAGTIRTVKQGSFNTEASGDSVLEMIRWVDKTSVTLMLPSRQGLVLDRYDHKMSRVPAVIAERPGHSDSPRGQFDDVIWVQVARSIMSTLALEAASIAVQAPIALPEDVDELNVGPHAVIQGKDANQIHRVGLDMPTSIFAEGQALDQELRVGARYPEARSGQPGTSVITGKGVEALLGTFDSQIKGAQIVFKYALQDVTSLCFEMDEAWWPNVSKTVNGTISGSSYEFSYVPSKDIAGRYNCTVTYGFAAGLAPAQSFITILQLEGAGLIAKGTAQENLPWQIDQVQEQRKVNIEGSRDALKQGVFALVQSSGQMAAQGQDPLPIINMAADMIRRLEQGESVEDSVSEAFQAMQQAQQQAQQVAQEAAQQSQEAAGGGPDMDNGGLGPQITPGQAGMPPGGRPTLESMVSGFRGNGSVPVMQNEIRRQVPTGTA